MEWIAPTITGCCLIIVAIIEAGSLRERKEAKIDRERSEYRAETRARESKLSMDLMSASCALSMVAAKKLTGMHTNGDVEKAMDSAEEAQKKYENFVNEIAARQVAKV